MEAATFVFLFGYAACFVYLHKIRLRNAASLDSVENHIINVGIFFVSIVWPIVLAILGMTYAATWLLGKVGVRAY